MGGGVQKVTLWGLVGCAHELTGSMERHTHVHTEPIAKQGRTSV